MVPEKDYPAAHSVDTGWYVVDKCGHLAHCWSSESGAVPNNAAVADAGGIPDAVEPEDEELEKRIQLHDSRAFEELAVRIGSHYDRSEFKTGSGAGRFIWGSPFLVLKDTLSEQTQALAVSEVLQNDGKLTTFQKGKFLVVGGSFSLKFWDEVHEKGLCVSCGASGRMDATMLDVSGKPPIINYRHPTWNGAPYPYFRTFVPEDLKTIKEMTLPKGLKQKLSACRTNFCFLEKPVWQPGETHKCEYYDGTDSENMELENGETTQQLTRELWGIS